MKKKFKDFLNIIPTPICSVALGFAGLSNLMSDYNIISYTYLLISIILLLIFTIKIFFVKKTFKNIFSSSLDLAALSTFPMAVSLIIAKISQLYKNEILTILWILFLVIHLIIIIYFTIKYLFKLKLNNVHAIWFVPYAGISAFSISSKTLSLEYIGFYIVIFAIISTFVLLIIISMRYVLINKNEDKLKPLFCIYAAPISIILTAYIKCNISIHIEVIYALLALSFMFYIIALLRMCMLIFKRFYPTHAAFTFPFVISASAFSASISILSFGPWSNIILIIMSIICNISCIYVIVEYIMFFVKKLKGAQ